MRVTQTPRREDAGGRYKSVEVRRAEKLRRAVARLLGNRGRSFGVLLVALAASAAALTVAVAGGASGIEPYQTYEAVVTADAPVAQYRFDEAAGATTLADSAGARTATVSAITLGGAGPFTGSKSGTFSLTSSQATLPSTPLSTATTFTAEAWVSWNGGASYNQKIFDLGSSTSKYLYLTPASSATGHPLRFQIRSTTSTAFQVDGPTLGNNGWQYVAVSEDSAGKLTLYVNGSQVAQTTGATIKPSTLGSTTNNWLGRSQTSTDPRFGGSMSNVAFYNKALSSTQILNHYNAGLGKPTNTAAPTASGTARDGQTLTGSAGTWGGLTPLTFSYQWRRCDSAGANCADVAGATTTSYVLASGDVGKTFRFSTTATNSAGSAVAASAATAVVAAAPPSPTVFPSISGAANQGQTLTANNGSWSGTPPITYTYQWRRCDTTGANCVDISGATAATYALAAADVGHEMRVVVKASNSAGSFSATTAATSVVAPPSPSNTVAPSVVGAAQSGLLLHADNGTWSGAAPISYSYQWQRCDGAGANCVDVTGATGSTYLLDYFDPGRTYRVTVTASNSAGSATAVSTASDVVSSSGPLGTVSKVSYWTGDKANGPRSLWVSNPDGSGAVHVLDQPACCGSTAPQATWFSLRWSPDGRKFVYYDGWGIAVMNADGTYVTRLSSNGGDWMGQGCDVDPTWSPDGRQIMFAHTAPSASGCGSATASLWVMDADGSNRHQVLAAGRQPAWSSDGHIAYVVWPGDGASSGLWVANSDGTSPSLIVPTVNPTDADQPAWSPSGAQLAYRRIYSSGLWRIAVIRPDGTGLVNVGSTYNEGSGAYPTWSPDGTRVAFMSLITVPPWQPRSGRSDGTDSQSMNLPAGAYGVQWSPWTTPDPSDDALLHRYAPHLNYDEGESAFADSAQEITDNSFFNPADNTFHPNDLQRDDGEVIADAAGDSGATLSLDFLKPAYDRDIQGTDARSNDWISEGHVDHASYLADAQKLHMLPEYANQMYGHAVVDPAGKRWLQYWFFEYYNEHAVAGVGYHEGDWEMVQVGLDANDQPDVMTFAQHKQGAHCTWDQVQKTPDGRPIVYPANGSHASYPKPGDYATPVTGDHDEAYGNGEQDDPDLTGNVLDDSVPWIQWPGHWGASKDASGLGLDQESPQGPKTHGQWANPNKFDSDAAGCYDNFENAPPAP